MIIVFIIIIIIIIIFIFIIKSESSVQHWMRLLSIDPKTPTPRNQPVEGRSGRIRIALD